MKKNDDDDDDDDDEDIDDNDSHHDEEKSLVLPQSIKSAQKFKLTPSTSLMQHESVLLAFPPNLTTAGGDGNSSLK